LSPPAREPTEAKGKFPLLSSPPPQSVTVEVRRIVDLYRELTSKATTNNAWK
jgi:hypothetical protein